MLFKQAMTENRSYVGDTDEFYNPFLYDESNSIADGHERHKASPEDVQYIKHYTGHDTENWKPHSHSLNKSLAMGLPLSDRDANVHKAIKRNLHNACGEFHLHSGVRRDVGAIANASPDRVMDCPAHISATPLRHVAAQFGSGGDVGNVQHMMNIRVTPKDKVLDVRKYADTHDEHEIIIPAGTKLKYHGKFVHKPQEDGDYTVHEHHFTIHSQE